MTELVLRRNQLGAVEPLGTGGTAHVYRIPQFVSPEPFEIIYKEYKSKILRSAGPGLLPGLHSIVEFRHRLDPKQRELLDQRSIWPLRVVVDDGGAAVGVLMRIIPPGYFQTLRLPSGGTETKPREAQFLLNGDEDAKKVGLPILGAKERISLCSQFVRCLGLLHHAKVVFGDISARNIIYETADPRHPGALLVDCDSVRVSGTVSPFGAQPHTPRWEPPEALLAKRRLAVLGKQPTGIHSDISKLRNQASLQNWATDVYKFGLLVVRVLDYGRGRSANRDPAIARRLLGKYKGADAALLLDHSLSELPSDRPSMRDWYDVVVRGVPASTSATLRPGSGPKVLSTVPARQNATVPAAPVASSAPTSSPSGRWRWVEGQGWVRAGP